MSSVKPAGRALFTALLALSAFLAGVMHPMPAAAAPTTIPQGPLPTGEIKPVELSSITIDATVAAGPGGTSLSVLSHARLRNMDKKAAYECQVTFPGVAVSGVRIGTQNGGLAPAGGGGPWTLSLRADGDAVIEGTQAVAIGGVLTELVFDWAALKPWGDTLAAARLTLHFADGVDSDQLLVVDPAPTARDTTQLTWSYEKLKPDGRVRVLFVSPASWQPLRTARQAAAGAPAGAAEFLALAAALRPLTAVEGMPAAVAKVLQSELLAALERAVAAAPKDSHPHQELAAYLRGQANGDAATLARAVAELKAAYDVAAMGERAVLEPPLRAAIDELIAACRRVGDTQGTLRALDVMQAVDPANSAQRAAAYADLAVSLLDAGRQGEAEAAIAAGFGQEALARYAIYRPHLRSVTAEVETHVGRRILRFSLVPAPGMAAAAEADVAALAGALGRSGGEVQQTAAEGALRLEVTIPFGDAQELRAAGLAVAGSLPADADPALALVAAVAAPTGVDLKATEGMQADRLAYAESANLGPAQQALQGRLDQLKFARSEAEARSDDPVEAARRRWALALLTRYEAGWQALARGCRVTYHIVAPEDIAAPQWALAWGEARQIGWSANIPHPERLWPVGVGAAGLIVAVAAVVAVVRRRR